MRTHIITFILFCLLALTVMLAGSQRCEPATVQIGDNPIITGSRKIPIQLDISSGEVPINKFRIRYIIAPDTAGQWTEWIDYTDEPTEVAISDIPYKEIIQLQVQACNAVDRCSSGEKTQGIFSKEIRLITDNPAGNFDIIVNTKITINVE